MIRLSRRPPKPTDGFYLRAESFFNVATYLDEIEVRKESFHKISHGEAFFELLANKFKGDGLYLLDEPEAALSPSRLLSAICLIDDLVGKMSQFIIATHSPILLAYPKSKIYQLSDKGVEEINYEDSEVYTLTRDFLNAPKRYINSILTKTENQNS